jgi:hypothetical protein
LPGRGILVENNSPNWVGNCNGLPTEIGSGGWVDNAAVGGNQVENGNSVSMLDPDLTAHTPLPTFFYQRHAPGQQRCRVESVPRQDSVKFDGVTSCSLDQEMVLSASGLKPVGVANGGISNKKKPQTKNATNMTMR